MSPHRHRKPEQKNLMIAIALSVMIILVWEYFYAMPQRRAAEAQFAMQRSEQLKQAPNQQTMLSPAHVPHQSREELLSSGARVKIQSPRLHGSVDLKGLRFNDLTLADYRDTIDKNSPEVVLLSPAGNEKAYFTEFGWVSSDPNLRVPDTKSEWKSDRDVISVGQPTTFEWNNGAGVTFRTIITLDENYLFSIDQQVINRSGREIAVSPYGRINRVHMDAKNNMISHEGPLAVLNGTLVEHPFHNLKEEPAKPATSNGGWIGMSDKYWLTALILPAGQSMTANFSHYASAGLDRYQVDYMGQPLQIGNDKIADFKADLFAGAKEVKLLDAYTKSKQVPLFDRAVDFGSLYFLTKPIFLLLNFFNSHLGNFGLAILLLTVVIKGLMFPLANKSYGAMSQMKRLQPEMAKIRERFPKPEDRMKMNQEVMAMYKREKVNPAGGCLPMLIQLPVFFALYKVLYVSIEMRHAPFYGWVKDLSAIDPTNIFTLFGLIDWAPPAWLPHIGVLAIVMCATMVIQQKISPQPTDPAQARVMSFLPYLFLFLFASFPAGLIIYWIWSNILTIAQQLYIMKRHGDSPPSRAKKAAEKNA